MQMRKQPSLASIADVARMRGFEPVLGPDFVSIRMDFEGRPANQDTSCSFTRKLRSRADLAAFLRSTSAPSLSDICAFLVACGYEARVFMGAVEVPVDLSGRPARDAACAAIRRLHTMEAARGLVEASQRG